MKKRLALLISTLSSSAVIAHPGHLAEESLHPLLHAEHILLLLGIGVAAYLVKSWYKK